MIRREEPEAVWVIRQAAHAMLAAQIAEHWMGMGEERWLPREDLLVAALNHDAGWAAHEAMPRRNTQGYPRTFTEMDLDEHFGIWEASIAAVFAQSRYAGLLTSRHCSALYDLRWRYVDDPPDHKGRVRAFLDERLRWEAELLTQLGQHPRYGRAVAAATLADNVRLLQVWDYLSLLLCMSTVAEQTLDDVPVQAGTRCAVRIAPDGMRGMALDPYPLDRPLTLWLDARRVIGGPFESDAALQSALAEAPYQPLAFEFSPF